MEEEAVCTWPHGVAGSSKWNAGAAGVGSTRKLCCIPSVAHRKSFDKGVIHDWLALPYISSGCFHRKADMLRLKRQPREYGGYMCMYDYNMPVFLAFAVKGNVWSK
uniref:Uncharacterized protein n=1 Tax=Leersia perrieri TaxID=77586 RepID=A0A0D9XZ74_9ORYZ